jgi:hypothetical protein
MMYRTTEWIFSRQTFLENLRFVTLPYYIYYFPTRKKKFIYHNSLTIIIQNAASTGGQRCYMKYVSFPWPPVVAAFSFSTFCSSFTHARKVLFLIHKLLMIR